MKYRTPNFNFIKGLFAKLPAFLLAFLFVFGQPLLILAEEDSGSSNQEIIQSEEYLTTPDTENNNGVVSENEITTQEEGASGGNNSDVNLIPDRVNDKNLQKIPDIDQNTGSLNYEYPIDLPSGINNLTPSVTLKYSSSNKEESDLFGYGWNINIPYIERINKTGVNNLYNTNNFYSSIDGELVEVSSGVYMPKVQSSQYDKYTYNGTYWVINTKDGRTINLGETSNSRQDDSAGTNVFRWSINKEADSNGDYISYNYYKDSGALYPDYIQYTNTNSPANGAYKVYFSRQTRPQIITSYKTGFSVKISYLISDIQVKFNSNLIRKYTLEYSTGDNGKRNILSSVQYSSYDTLGVLNTLPKTTFSYLTNTTGWTNTTSWNFPFDSRKGMLVGDINGDGYQDLIQSYYSTNNPSLSKKDIYINNKTNGWALTTAWSYPSNLGYAYNTPPLTPTDTGIRLIDLNGDGYADLIRSMGGIGSNAIYESYINNKTNSWTYSSSWSVIPEDFVTSYGPADTGTRLLDVNSDGLVDLVNSYSVNGNNYSKIYFNNGSGWTYDSNWSVPVGFPRGTQIGDVNGDGLPDITQAFISWNYIEKGVYLNNGKNGWDTQSSYTLPQYYFINAPNTPQDQGARMFDYNGDGLSDLLRRTGGLGCSVSEIDLNKNENVWSIQSGYGSPTDFNNCQIDPGTQVLDVNSDGLLDLANGQEVNYTLSTETYTKNGAKPDLLTKITLPNGGYYDFTYSNSAQMKDGSGNLLNASLSIVVDVVKSMTSSDGLGNSSVTNYEYADGSYYYNNAFDRKFAGFGKVTKTNPDNTKEVSYYSQGNATNTTGGEYDDHVSKIGKVYRTDILDSSNNLVKQDTTKWEKYQINSADAYFVYPVQTMSRTFTGSSSYDTAEAYTYNTSNGNLNQKIEYGQVGASGYQSFSDTGTDKRTTDYSYASCSTANCTYMYLPSQVTLKDNSNNKISEVKLYYDNLPLGQIDVGNNTKESKWVTGTTYANTTKTYNPYGLVTSTTDPRGKTTNYVYDSYNLYPASITNPLSQTTTHVYDYNSGKPKKITNANAVISETDYDGFGRPLAERSSSDTSKTSLITLATYTYNDTMGVGGAVPYIKKTTNYSSTFSGDTYILLDGLGRTIRTVQQTDTSSYKASDTVYDSMGRVQKTSLPYIYSGSITIYSGPTTNTNIITTSTYDALGRLTSMSNTLGTTSNTYNLNKITNYDQEGKQKDIHKDAFGNIIQITEYNNSSSYNTYYYYDANNNLISMVDALSNTRSFAYDALGNRLGSTDLHDVSDTDYGSYSYTYDSSNNLIQKNTPNGDSISYTYDDINRITNESNNGTTQIVYTYDSCLNGIGLLCSVSRTGSTTKNNIYTSRGLISSVNETLGAKSWLISNTYNYTGANTQITYPDGSKVSYVRNRAGQITAIQRQEPSGAWVDVLTQIVYTPLGQRQTIAYANGRTETYTYDTNKQYQLTRLAVDAPMGYPTTNMQELNYILSSTGNLNNLNNNTDPLNPRMYSYTYDDLHRLTSATLTVNPPASGYTENYVYNAIGNLTSKTGAGSYTYDGTASGDYTNPHAALGVGSNNYIYDKNGNLTNFGTSPNNTTLTYSYRNELNQYQRLGSGPITNIYTYDESGMRVKAVDSGGTTYTPNKYYEEIGTKKQKHIYLDDLLVATIIKDGTNPSTATYVHHDHLGGTTIVTDQSGVMQLQKLEYYPFGSIYSNTSVGSFDQSKKYTGHEYDADTDLNYMQARYQYGLEGRFWQQDPVAVNVPNDKLQELLTNPQLWNTYSYGSNNPLKYVDMDGNFILPYVLRYLYEVGSGQRGVPSPVREAAFVASNPGAAYYIGKAKDGYEGNISSVSSNFAVNTIRAEFGYSADQSKEGTERNALRHVVWQSLISSTYGVDVATSAGNSHEYNPHIDLNSTSFRNQEGADQAADLLNNIIGRQIYLSNKGLSPNQLTQKALDHFHSSGLYTTKENTNGGYSLVKSTISNQQYKNSSEALSKLGITGKNK